MHEEHAARVRARLTEISKLFDSAQATGNSSAAHEQWLALLQITDQAIMDALAARLEAQSLATELRVYRPTRDEETPAPVLDGYVYVHTATFPWVCASLEIVEFVSIPGLAGVLGYRQEHSTWQEKTVCGKKAFYPVSERFTSGGWPRLRELCPECTRRLWEIPQQRELFPTTEAKEVTACGI